MQKLSSDNRLTFTYDAVGNLLTAQDADGAYTLTYDALNRPSTVIDLWGNTLTFTWDAAGNRTKVEDSKGGETNSTFDDLNRLTNRQLLVDEDVQLTVTQEYNAEGRVTNLRRYGHGAPAALIAGTSYTYDNVGRLTNLHHQGGLLDNSINATYAYDAHSRLTSEIRNGSGFSYTYDDTDQLTADGAVTVTYDANGNRTNGSYGVGAGNRMTTDGTWTYTYDDEGNLTKKSQGANALTWTYGYDHRNQLTHAERRATEGGTLELSADYKYDVFGNRIEKSVDDDGVGSGSGEVTRFAYDGWKNTNRHLVGNENWDIWADLDSSGSLTTRYARGDVIDELFARIESSGAFWYLTDRLGSIRDVVDSDGDIVDNITYDGFGNILSESAPNYRGRYAWTGREVDVETELQYNRARYYDAKIGRWISWDPLGFDAGDSNLYRYVRNEPTGATDPSGLDEFDTRMRMLLSRCNQCATHNKTILDRQQYQPFAPKSFDSWVKDQLAPGNAADFGKLKKALLKDLPKRNDFYSVFQLPGSSSNWPKLSKHEPEFVLQIVTKYFDRSWGYKTTYDGKSTHPGIVYGDPGTPTGTTKSDERKTFERRYHDLVDEFQAIEQVKFDKARDEWRRNGGEMDATAFRNGQPRPQRLPLRESWMDFVPVVGSIRHFLHEMRNENFLSATLHLVMAVDEVFFVHALGKGLVHVAKSGLTRAGATPARLRGVTGAGEVFATDAQAEAAYNLIRNLNGDVTAISRNTGIPENVVRSVRQHLFEQTHEVALGPGQLVRRRFDADGEIAELWIRAAGSGRLTAEEAETFRRIIAHEYVEQSLMRHGGMPFRSADPRAWVRESGEWVYRPTPEAFGAHDMAPRIGFPSAPYGHYPSVLGIGR